MNNQPRLLDVVALVDDFPGEKLARGQVRTVVELLDDQRFEVEFSDDQGKNYALDTLAAQQLLVLHHGPVSS